MPRSQHAVRDERPGLLPYLQSIDYIAHQVWAQLFTAFPRNEVLDARQVSQSLRANYPGLGTPHWPVASIYDDPLLVVDFSKLMRTFFRADTVSVGGTLVGTDKIIHFINLGRMYHAATRRIARRGKHTIAPSPGPLPVSEQTLCCRKTACWD